MFNKTAINTVGRELLVVDSLRYFIGPLNNDTVPYNKIAALLNDGYTYKDLDLDDIVAEMILQDAEYRAKYFAAWRQAGVNIVQQTVGVVGFRPDAYDQLIKDIAFWWRVSQISDEIVVIASYSDIEKVRKYNKLGIILGVQDTTFLDRDLRRLEIVYNLGVRVVQPTYNMMNNMGTGCTERVDAGLSFLGLELIKRLESLGIIIDASHCSYRTTMDILSVSTKPIVFTHTVCKAVYAHARGKTDEELQAVAETGGYVGIALVPAFLTNAPVVTLEDFFKHLQHAIEVCGLDHVGIGTDWGVVYPSEIARWKTVLAKYEGFRPEHGLDYSATVAGFECWTDWPNIISGLAQRGYTRAQIAKIVGENFLNVFKKVVG